MILFLDFDGVLRRSSAPRYQLENRCREPFEALMREYPDVRIVITSSWREAYSLAQIKGHFSADIAGRILGVTPIAQDRHGCYRHREVLAFLKRGNLESEPWVAVDDDPE